MQNLTKATRLVKRRHTKLSDQKMTDQSFKKSCDINNIVKYYSKTGNLPNTGKIPKYGDFSEVPTLETAFDIAHAAQDAFYKLPSDVRKLIDNDASKLESFITDEKNKELCEKYGLIDKKPEKPLIKEDPEDLVPMPKKEDNSVKTDV